MAQDQTPITDQTTPQSGLLLGVDRLPGALDRGKASGSTADDDGND